MGHISMGVLEHSAGGKRCEGGCGPVQWHVVVSKKDSARPSGTREYSRVAIPGFRPPARTAPWAVLVFSLREKFGCSFISAGGKAMWASENSSREFHLTFPCHDVAGAARNDALARTGPSTLCEGNYHRRGCVSKSSRSFPSFSQDFLSTAWCAGP